MSGYRQRAPFYRSEFTVRDDFTLIGRMLAGDDGLVVDIPSGPGRLLPVHQSHGRDVIMVDVEPAMIERCREGIMSGGLGHRVSAVQGDITTWQAPELATRVVVARGGLQVLGSQWSAIQALITSATSLAEGGLLYFDIAMPWTAAPSAMCDLAPFLQFSGRTQLEGHSYFDLGGIRIRRSYTSILLADRVVVHLRYEAEGAVAGWHDFETEAAWHKLDVGALLRAMKKANLTVICTLGGYAGACYAAGSARFICIARV